MSISRSKIILGSRSPRRLELLSLLVTPDRIEVVVPENEEEAGFDERRTLPEILSQLAAIARHKNCAVEKQIEDHRHSVILTADTVVIVSDSEGKQTVLGKPDGADWQQTTRSWFENYYLGRVHHVATGICLRTPNGELHESQTLTQVRFRNAPSELVEWYLQTGEPLGKAGGYGLQGAGSVFVESVVGSPSNVIGLPLEPLWSELSALNLI